MILRLFQLLSAVVYLLAIPLRWIRDALQKLTPHRSESSPAPGPPQSSAPVDSSAPPPPPGSPPPPPPQAEAAPGAAEPQPEPVRLGASAPDSVRPGDHFVAQFAAYVRAQEEEVRKAFVALSRRSEPKLGLKTCRWKLNTPVKVMLTGEHLTVDPSMDEFVWEGDHNLLSFEVSVDAGAPEGSTVLKYHVYIGDVRVAMLPLEIEIGARPASTKPKEVTAEPARTAFASYASEDRDRVLDRIAEAKLSAGLEVFMDCISLRAGSDWERCLEQEIKDRDLFLLFWSSHAKDSKWVTWEWQTALRQKGLEAIRLRPLQPVREAVPPEELQRLHFDDPLMVMHEYYRVHPPGASE